MGDPAPPSFETLRAWSADGVGHLVLDQPDRLNPIGAHALRELAAAARWFDDAGPAVVVVSGAGRAFSAGFDLRELHQPGPDAAATPELGAAMAEAVAGMGALTVARVQGPCVGGGFVLALCCDLRVAGASAWFLLPEAELGIPLAWSGVPRLVRELGPARAAELVLTCRRVPAAEAGAWGLVNQVVADGDLDRAVDDLVAVLAARRPEVVRATKAQVAAAAEALAPTTGAWAGTAELQAALRALGAPDA